MASNDLPEADRFFVDYCDSEANWGPLLFLRPARHERLGLRRTLVMSVLLGSVFGVLGDVLLLLAARFLHKPSVSPLPFPLVLTVAYFVVQRVTIAPAWNRRAARLARSSRDR
jgi:hypothetical protein